jgi:hypothetical protein
MAALQFVLNPGQLLDRAATCEGRQRIKARYSDTGLVSAPLAERALKLYPAA